MKQLISVMLGAACALAISGFAFAAPDENLSERADASQVLSRGFDKNEASEDSRQAEMASQRGDWAVSASFAERSYRENPDIRDEFNLATAYEHIGQGGKAVPLYIDLVERGQFTKTQLIDNYDGLPQSPLLPVIADEAALRLNRMSAQTASRTTNMPAPVIAEN